ncbi:ArsR/SmtB family transcription factor [Bacillus sp. SJS]|uniref:ArsR/SmtB family transcription factor n=1 Tax=Bacillus sp. SJS TaxID=1423321 RepID=UPI0004DCB504|nr:ArsR family transcriptional regulator [Bacillus sp. SJS]KZZ86166.1 transcriptional regulator [Bacillus sp. SJS]
MEFVFETGRERETYQVEVRYSLLWEAALGITAITNTPLIKTLEQPESEWKRIKDSLQEEMLDHLDYAEKNNTWKALLQLLHEEDFEDLSSFAASINSLSDEAFKCICLPFLGSRLQKTRKEAAGGDEASLLELQKAASWNPFFPAYIELVCKEDPGKLKKHLLHMLTGWYEAAVKPDEERINRILKRDVESKSKMAAKMKPEPFVEWATEGRIYPPEPSIHHVLLIPHTIYRPWNIEADFEDTKVFFYPASNESIYPNDPFIPPASLVQKHKALGDEIRLKIIKMLSVKGRTLQEVTDELGMGKTTIHHHLKTLKGARLVEVKESKYFLRQVSLQALSEELNQFLDRK